MKDFVYETCYVCSVPLDDLDEIYVRHDDNYCCEECYRTYNGIDVKKPKYIEYVNTDEDKWIL